MKRFATIIFLLFVTNLLFSQSTDSLITFSGVVAVDSVSQKDLTIRARQWFINQFEVTKGVLQVNDLENGEVSGNGSFQYIAKLKTGMVSQPVTGTINLKITILTKDGKYKYEIGPFAIESTQTAYGSSGIGSLTITSSPTHPNNAAGKTNKSIQKGLNDLWKQLQEQCTLVGKKAASSLEAAMKKDSKADF